MQAMATGVMMVMVMSLILLTFPRESRGKAMGLVSLVIGFAPAVGPSLGGLLVDLVGWRALFCIVVIFSILIILFALRSLKNREGFPRTSADVASIVFSSIGLASLLYGLSSFASSDHVELCVALMVVRVVFVALFVRRQFKLDEPMLRLEVLRSRRYRTAFIVCAILQAILIGLSVIMPLYIQNILGYSATISGLATLPGATVNQVGASLGTALIMSFSALGTSMAPEGTALEQTFYGYHWSFAAILVIAAIVLLVVVLFVRNMKSDKLPVVARPNQGEFEVYRVVGEVMDTNPVVVFLDAPMSAAAKTLAMSDSSGAVIVDEQGMARGFISNSDILRFFSDESKLITGMSGFVVFRELDDKDVRKQISRMKDIRVSDVATRKVIGVSPDTTLGEACKMLAEKRLKLLPVLDDGKLVGIVHRSSLLRLIADVLEEDEQ